MQAPNDCGRFRGEFQKGVVAMTLHRMNQELDRRTSGAAGVDQSDNILVSCCQLVSNLHTIPSADAVAWLSRAAAGVSSLIRPGTACWIMDASLDEATANWSVHAFAIEGSANAEAARCFREQAARGFAAEDATFPPAREFGVPSSFCLPREDIYPGASWGASKYRRLCAEAGVRDFARCVVELDHQSPRRWLVVEVQGLDAGWSADTDVLRVLGALSQGISRAYEHRFLRLERLRASLTERISPAGHAVLPLLAEGLSEAEIGRRIHRSTHTVHDHVKQIYRVLGVTSRLELRDVWMGEREVPKE
jgi:DNA-binding CsgD family transcriptional regulator